MEDEDGKIMIGNGFWTGGKRREQTVAVAVLNLAVRQNRKKRYCCGKLLMNLQLVVSVRIGTGKHISGRIRDFEEEDRKTGKNL